MDIEPEEQSAVEEVAARLRARFPTVEPTTVDKAVDDSYHSLDGANIRTFVGILTEKQAREVLESK